MAAIQFLLALLQSLLHVQEVGEELDKATQERMQQHASYLSREMTRLLQEIELKNAMEQRKKQEMLTLEQSGMGWEALLFAALPWFVFAVIAGVLFLLCRWLRKRRNGRDQKPVREKHVDEIFTERIQQQIEEQAHKSRVVKELLDELIHILRLRLSKSYWPEPQQPIGVGAAFEGWSSCEDDPIYCLLVPLKPPRGYVFKLGLDYIGDIPAEESFVRVEQECTCSKEEAGGECFVHHPTEEMRRRPPGLSHILTLCTRSNLDVQKTASWFQSLVSSAWDVMPQSCQYRMKVLPSSRSCLMQLTSVTGKPRGGTFSVEIVFGVQRHSSDIFLSSEPRDPVFNPSTMWPVSYIVAEGKIFREIAARAPRGSFHLKCLQACTSILVGTSFSTHIMKIVFMHLMTTIPLSHWRDRDFVPRLQDIMWYLYSSLKKKRLDHFFLGNKNLPEEINLPAAFQRAKPCNLFHHLARDPATHAQALKEFEELLDQLVRLLYYGKGKDIDLHPPEELTAGGTQPPPAGGRKRREHRIEEEDSPWVAVLNY